MLRRRSLLHSGIGQNLAGVGNLAGALRHRQADFNNLCQQKVVGLNQMVQVVAQGVLIRTDVDEHGHIAVGQPLDHPNVLLHAVHHLFKGPDHRANLVVLIVL